MELTFNKQGSYYIADLQAFADFNIHIEKGEGSVYILQSTVLDGEYDYVKDLYLERTDPVIDVDMTALVYPKYIRIKSRVLPTKAVVTFA